MKTKFGRIDISLNSGNIKAIYLTSKHLRLLTTTTNMVYCQYTSRTYHSNGPKVQKIQFVGNSCYLNRKKNSNTNLLDPQAAVPTTIVPTGSWSTTIEIHKCRYLCEYSVVFWRIIKWVKKLFAISYDNRGRTEFRVTVSSFIFWPRRIHHSAIFWDRNDQKWSKFWNKSTLEVL